jgi:hypothetical protein
MKKFMLCNLLFIAAFSTVFAQSATTQDSKIEGYVAKSPSEHAKDATDKLNETVKLSPEQYSKILEVNRQFFTNAQPGATNTSPAQLGNERESKIKAILTADQYKKLGAAKEKTN